MTEAWMRRGAERQDLLEKIKRDVLDEQAETHQYERSKFAFNAALLEYLSEQNGNGPPTQAADTPERRYLRERVLPAIAKFARTPIEARALVAELYLWHCETIAKRFKAELQSEGARDPEKVFGGRRAMDEVD